MITEEIWKNTLSTVPAEWLPTLEGMSITADTINSTNVFNVLSQNETWKSLQTVSMTIPTGLFGTWQVFKQNNGLFILPVLACVTQFLMSAGQNQQQPTPDNGKGTGNFMKYFFPLITLFFCFSYNAAFALYWVVSNIYAWIETIVLNKVIEKKDKEETAVIEEDGIK
jgi:membrane protein insertase Oxa1/YidC/SpoIIIJ